MITIFEQIILFLISGFAIFFGVWVYLQDKKNKSNFWFMIASFCILGWVNFAYFGSTSNEILRALFLYRLNWGIVTLFIFSFYLFIFYYLKKNINIWDKINLSILIILSFLSFFTNLIIKETIIKEWGAEVVFGELGIFYKFFAFFATLFVLKYLLSYYFSVSKIEKLKVQYFILGVVLFVIGNTIFNVILPTILDTVKYQHFGDFSAIFFLGFTAYAIVKKELFGIKIVLVQIIFIILSFIILIQTIFTPSLEWKIINGIILICFIFFGIYLVKAIKNEEERTRKLEELVKQEKKLREESESLVKEFEKLSDIKNQFIMATQHHLRTPLTSMRGYLDLIEGGTYGKVPKKIEEVLKRFQVSTIRLVRMVNEFLDISQFQLGKEVVFLRPKGKIEPILKEMEDELTFQAEDKGIKLKIKKPKKTLPFIKADIEKLKAAFFNIADNAIKYTQKGNVSITTEVLKKDSKIRVYFKDTGIGLSKEDQKNLFIKLFERGTEAKKAFSMGRGIGLYLSYQIVKAHKGKLWAESEGEGKGSTFIFELPIDVEEKEK